MGAGKWPRILELGHNTQSLSGARGRIFYFCTSFLCHVTLKLAVDRQSRMGLIFTDGDTHADLMAAYLLEFGLELIFARQDSATPKVSPCLSPHA